MNRIYFSPAALLLALLCFDLRVGAADEFNVLNFGARGNGTNLDTAAFQKALDTCGVDGGTVVVPAGDYLIGSLVIKHDTTLELADGAELIGSPNPADYPLEKVRYEGEFVPGHRALLSANNARNIVIFGHGHIYGPPFPVSRLRNPRGPVLMEFTSCTNVTLDGFTTQYQRLWSIHPLFCRNFVAKNLKIRSVDVNGDGIDVDSCKDVLIDHCDINTGDDAIALKSGRGEAALRLACPTEDVIITNCTLASSTFAALAIGTELSGGIRNVSMENCDLSGHQNGIFFKSRDGRGGFIENFTGANLTVHDSPTFLRITLLNTGIQATDPVTDNPGKWTKISDVHFNHIRVSNIAHVLLATDVPPDQPVHGFSLDDIQGICHQALDLANMENVTLRSICLTNYQGPLLTQLHVRDIKFLDAN